MRLALVSNRLARCALFAATSCSALANAAEPRSNTPAPQHDPPLPPGDRKRPTPDYDGQPPSTNAGTALLWVPRLALLPLYLVTEYGLRRPVVALMTRAEEHHWREQWDEFFTLDQEKKLGLFPTGRIDLGFRTHVGFYFFWLDALGDSDFKLNTTTGGLDSWTVNALLLTPLGPRDQLSWRFDYGRHPDSVFYGLGEQVTKRAAHYGAQRFVGRVRYDFRQQQVSVFSGGGLLSAQYDPSERSSESSLTRAIESGRLEAPPALEDGLLSLHTAVGVRYDTRPPRVGPPASKPEHLELWSGTGFTSEVHVAQHAGLRGTRATSMDESRVPHWLRYGASAVGVWDITGLQRTLQLEAMVELAEPLPGDNAIPFTEQVSLGGSRPMRAFQSGHLIDTSAAVATLSYGWPIWTTLDGNLHYSIGNVFGDHFDGFALGALRSSFGVGVETVGSHDNPFEMLLAFGTEPFAEGGRIETFRFVFGTRSGF